MLIDCTTCVARDIACADCVVTVLLASPPPALAAAPSRPPGPRIVPDRVDLDESERAALGLLAEAGLVPPLRLVQAVTHGHDLSDTG